MIPVKEEDHLASRGVTDVKTQDPKAGVPQNQEKKKYPAAFQQRTRPPQGNQPA
jgi:hypothetical protein